MFETLICSILKFQRCKGSADNKITKTFPVINLDNKDIFLDETYAIHSNYSDADD